MNQPWQHDAYYTPTVYDGWQADPAGLPAQRTKLSPAHPAFNKEDSYAPGWWTDGYGQRRRLEDLSSEHLICIAGMLWRYGVCERFGLPHQRSSVPDLKGKLREVLHVLEMRAEAR